MGPQVLVPDNHCHHVLQRGVIPWYLTMKTLGLTNNFLAYILPTIVAPFYIVLVKTFVESTPRNCSRPRKSTGPG